MSSATPTTIRRPVPPKLNGTDMYFCSSAGIMHTTDRYSAPANVMRDSTRSMYCAVFLPGRIPGMKPPDFFRLSATSIGLMKRPVHVALDPSHEPEAGSSNRACESESEWLYRAIRQLSEIDRALVMCYLDGMSYRGIGEVLGLSEANVGTRLNRAKARLQELARQRE